MNLTKEINLHGYAVEYIDLREPKPRTVRTETLVLDGGRISAAKRLGVSLGSYIDSLYNAHGYRVSGYKKIGAYTAAVDLAPLWHAEGGTQ